MPVRRIPVPLQALLRPVTPERRRLGTLVVITGVVGSGIGVAYLALLDLVEAGLGPESWGPASHIVVLVLVGVAAAGLTRWLGRSSGVELLVDDIHVSGGHDEVRGLRSLLPVSLLCVGSGAALGPEAPLVTTTGTLGSRLGARSDLDPHRRRIVAITGMAAGFTVLFGAPLGSAIFSLEILHRRGMEYHEALLPAVGGALCGYAAAALTTGLGLEPLWDFPGVDALTAADLGWSVIAGVAGALVATAFAVAVRGLERILAPLPADSLPILGGIALGGLALITPYALTFGEAQIDELTFATVTLATLALAAGAKLVAAAVSLVCGWRGGFIIPLFFMGFCLGQIGAELLPGAHTWVLVAALMVAANVGVTKTPLGSTLVVTEMGGLTLLPSTLLAAIVALALTAPVGIITSQRTRNDDQPDLTDPEAER